MAPQQEVVIASAPARIDLAGGSGDIFHQGVFNVAVEAPNKIGYRAWAKVTRGGGSYGVKTEPLAYPWWTSETADLAREAAHLLDLMGVPADQVSLDLRTTIPRHSGLGGSSALLAALATAVAELQGRHLNRYQVAEYVDHAGRVSGQVKGCAPDYATAWGGATYIACPWRVKETHGQEPGALYEEPLAVVEDWTELWRTAMGDFALLIRQPAEPMVPQSGVRNFQLVERYGKGDPIVVQDLEKRACLAHMVRTILVLGTIATLQHVVATEVEIMTQWDWVSHLAELTMREAKLAGALAAKPCGAGGAIAILCPRERLGHLYDNFGGLEDGCLHEVVVAEGARLEPWWPFGK